MAWGIGGKPFKEPKDKRGDKPAKSKPPILSHMTQVVPAPRLGTLANAMAQRVIKVAGVASTPATNVPFMERLHKAEASIIANRPSTPATFTSMLGDVSVGMSKDFGPVERAISPAITHALKYAPIIEPPVKTAPFIPAWSGFDWVKAGSGKTMSALFGNSYTRKETDAKVKKAGRERSIKVRKEKLADPSLNNHSRLLGTTYQRSRKVRPNVPDRVLGYTKQTQKDTRLHGKFGALMTIPEKIKSRINPIGRLTRRFMPMLNESPAKAPISILKGAENA